MDVTLTRYTSSVKMNDKLLYEQIYDSKANKMELNKDATE